MTVHYKKRRGISESREVSVSFRFHILSQLRICEKRFITELQCLYNRQAILILESEVRSTIPRCVCDIVLCYVRAFERNRQIVKGLATFG